MSDRKNPMFWWPEHGKNNENRVFWWPEQIENLKILMFWWPEHGKHDENRVFWWPFPFEWGNPLSYIYIYICIGHRHFFITIVLS